MYRPPGPSHGQTASGITEKLQLVIMFVSGKVVHLSVFINEPLLLGLQGNSNLISGIVLTQPIGVFP